MRKGKRSIRTRMLSGILVLIGVAFASIFVVFNIAMDSYINGNSVRQLDIARDMITRHQPDGSGQGEPPPELDRQPKNPVGAQAKVFFWDGVSTLQPRGDHAGNDVLIAQELDIDAALTQAQTVHAGDGVFLVSAVRNAQQDEYAILYVDITDIRALAQNINSMLVVILAVVGGIAVAVAFLLAGSVARPIRQISGFARQIGNGVFEPVELGLRDSETHQLQEVMNTTARKLKQYDSEQKTFFQNVSHELKTPLMTIRCNAEGIACGVMQPAESSALIIQETDRLGELIDDLLYVSRLDTITDNEVMEDVDLREILSACTERHRAIANARGVTFTFDFSAAPVVRRIAEKSMKRALGNVLSNAVRYARTQVRLYCHTADGRAVLRIADDGPGISATDMPHIFERFYKGAGGEHGIGLSITKTVVDRLGGNISVENDGGTVFTIIL